MPTPLFKIRTKHKLSLRDMSQAVGLDISTYFRVENGTAVPRRPQLAVLMAGLRQMGAKVKLEEIVFPQGIEEFLD